MNAEASSLPESSDGQERQGDLGGAGGGTITRRQWLVRKAILAGASAALAEEAVASVGVEHPEWNMSERKTLEDWESA